MKMRLIGLGLLGVLGAVSGCAKETGGPTILEARAQPYVRDIPVPKGFNRDERRSHYDSTAGRRSVKDFYTGDKSLLAVRNFYVYNMPLAGWQLGESGEHLQNGVYLLNFKKGEQLCEIRIERTPTGFLGGEITQICATIPNTKTESSD